MARDADQAGFPLLHPLRATLVLVALTAFGLLVVRRRARDRAVPGTTPA